MVENINRLYKLKFNFIADRELWELKMFNVLTKQFGWRIYLVHFWHSF